MRLPFQRVKESATSGATIQRVAGRPIYTTTNLEAFAREGYIGNPDIYTAIKVKARAFAGVDWVVETKGKDGEWAPVDSHPLQDLILRPNPQQGNTQFMYGVCASKDISGQYYIEAVGPKQGAPREMYLHMPHRMSIIAGNAIERVAGYEYKTQGGKVRLDANLVLHGKTYHPTDDFYGLSPIEVAAKLVDQAVAALDQNLAMLQNGGIPDGFLKHEADLTPKQLEQLKEELATSWRTAAHNGLPGLLTMGMDFKAAGLSPKDMLYMDLQRMHARKFAMIIGVPPELVDGEAKKFANYAEALTSLMREGVLPELDELRDELNRWLVPMFDASGRTRLNYRADDIEALQEDRDALHKRAADSWSKGVAQRNEARAMIGLPAIDGGDVFIDEVSGAFGPAPVPVTVEKHRTKALSVDTEEQKVAYWKAIDGQRASLEEKISELFEEQMIAETKAVVKAIEEAGPLTAIMAMEKAIDAQADAWQETLKQVYVTAAKPFAEQTLEQLKAQAGPRMMKAGDDWKSRVLAYIAKHGAQKITDIGNTTKDAIAGEISKGIDAGEGISVLAKRIDEYQLEKIIPNRSRTIARTEIVGASNAGSNAAAESTGLPLDKSWLSTRDGRTRSSHAEVDGTTVTMGEAFRVNGSELQWPGDGSLGAAAGEIVNCRCSHTFNVRDE